MIKNVLFKDAIFFQQNIFFTLKTTNSKEFFAKESLLKKSLQKLMTVVQYKLSFVLHLRNFEQNIKKN